MPHDLYVVRTVNGTPRTIRWRNLPDDVRDESERLLADFQSGMAMEHTCTINLGREPKTWRWCDIRDVWIEES